ncbi:hypothetical protein, partial [Aureimonas sp. AU4]|uniref:hypothetical protein n=1 Tax=Aureimonas sp. AU4 TaxID=1638163 RepID=UPI000A66A8D0
SHPWLKFRGSRQNDRRFSLRRFGHVNAWIFAQAGRDDVKVTNTTKPLTVNGTMNPTRFSIDTGVRIHIDAKSETIIGHDVLAPLIATMITTGSVCNQDPTVPNLIGATVSQLAGNPGPKAAIASGGVATDAKLTRVTGVVASGVASDDWHGLDHTTEPRDHSGRHLDGEQRLRIQYHRY